MPGRLRSRSPSEEDEEELQNLSFVSHMSNLGHGVSNVPVALESIVAANANAAHADGRDAGGGINNVSGGSGDMISRGPTPLAANGGQSSPANAFASSSVVSLGSGVGILTSIHRHGEPTAAGTLNSANPTFINGVPIHRLSPSASSITDAAAGIDGHAEANRADLEAELAEELKDITILGMAKKFLFTGWPLTLSTLAQFSLNLVIISVVGKFVGLAELGGASLALGLVNATGFAFGAGLCGALETVLSHTYGKYRTAKEHAERVAQLHSTMEHTENNNNNNNDDNAPQVTLVPTTLYMYGTYAQRMAIILFIAMFPLGIVLCFADAILKLVGEEPSAVYYTGVWCRYAVFGIPATMAYQLVQRYYSCQHITKPLSIAMIAAALANPALQIIFIKIFGFHGSPIGWLVLMTGIVSGLVGYLWFTGLYKLTWDGWDNKALKNLKALTAIALPSMGVMLSEWVALEINALAAGFAPTNELAAFAITTQMFGIMWGVASGPIILTCVFVGNAVGAGHPMQAKRIAFIAIGVVFCVSCIVVVIFLILNPYLPYLFTNSHEVAHICQHLMYLVIPYHFFDAFQSCVMAIMRGCELQKLGAVLITFTFCVIGVPLSFLLFFYFKIGVRALWIGPFSAVAGVGMPMYFFVLLKYIDWENLKPHKEEVQLIDDDHAVNNNDNSNNNADDNTGININQWNYNSKNKAEGEVASPSSAINALAADFATHNHATSVNPLQSNSLQPSVKGPQAMTNLSKIKEVYEGEVDSVKADNNDRAVLHQREGSEVINGHESSNTAKTDTHDTKHVAENVNHINKQL